MTTSPHPLRCAALSALLLAGCIERPWQDAPRRPTVDRAALRDVLLPVMPDDLVLVGASFGNGAVELVGYRLDPPGIAAGARLRITLYWRCKADLDAWHVFVHLDDANGSGERIHAEHDPAGGRFPTDAWQPGDLIADSFTVSPGSSPLNLFLGFYSTGETRLKLDSVGRGRNDGNNRLWAGLIPLAK